MVLSTDPGDGAIDVDPAKGTLILVFDESMDAGLAQTLTWEDGATGVAIPHDQPAGTTTFSWAMISEPNDTLMVAVSWVRFPGRTTLRWVLHASGLKDKAGNPIAGNVARRFTTGLVGYHPPSGHFSGPAASGGDLVTTDTDTGLAWKTCTEGMSGSDCTSGSAPGFDWYKAINACAALNRNGGYGGIKGWRLPTIQELQSLINAGAGGSPWVFRPFFPNAVTGGHWSATTVSSNPPRAWVVDHASGVTADGEKRYLARVQCAAGP